MARKRKSSQRQSNDSSTAGITTGSPSARTGLSRRTSPEEFAEEYSYVAQDLRRIFILAVIMFAIMIGLNLILH